MKQGRASRDVSESHKREPIAHSISTAATAEIGILEARIKSVPLYKGRGFEAPMNTSQSHKSGSQGKY
jgi:hypothetical protein